MVRHPSGRIFFVAGAWAGETAEFRIKELRGRSGEAQIVKLIDPSTERRNAPCPHQGFDDGHCGGCPWQFMNYNAQLVAKQARVEKEAQALDAAETVAQIWGSAEEFGYRNRAHLRTDGFSLGFQAGQSRSLVDVPDCLVLNPHNRETLRQLRERLPERSWQGDRRGALQSLHIDDDVTAAQAELNTRLPFRQGNSEQNRRMGRWLTDQLGKLSPSTERRVVELFAGSGNFTELIAREQGVQILAVDSFAPAIATLEQRGLPNVSARCLALDRDDAVRQLQGPLSAADLLVLDPGRDGLENMESFLKAMPQLQHVLYISCDPATWRRDVVVAQSFGFHLIEVQPVDLFPQTPHVEILSRLSRKG